ncbi:diadenosine tetraphosphate hydrolase, partial [Nocardia tengchongensis]
MSEATVPAPIVDTGAGDPDRLQRLWTPYRMSYITGEAEERKVDAPKKTGHPFTDIPEMSDEDGLIVARGETVYAVLNLYPY